MWAKGKEWGFGHDTLYTIHDIIKITCMIPNTIYGEYTNIVLSIFRESATKPVYKTQ